MTRTSTLQVNEAVIPDKDEVDLWGVRGIPGALYPTKAVAEVAARLAFPEQRPEQRYARLYSMKFYRSY